MVREDAVLAHTTDNCSRRAALACAHRSHRQNHNSGGVARVCKSGIGTVKDQHFDWRRPGSYSHHIAFKLVVPTCASYRHFLRPLAGLESAQLLRTHACAVLREEFEPSWLNHCAWLSRSTCQSFHGLAVGLRRSGVEGDQVPAELVDSLAYMVA